MEQAVRKIALLGMGTVGGGVYEIIEKQKEEMPFKIGAALEVVKVLVRNKAKYADRIPAEKLTDVWEDVIGDDSIDIVVEVMGGIEPARTYIKAALEKGKHVVTANKDLMAMHGHELLELAGEHHCDLLFEAAVAGGIPIIRPLKQCLAGNNITEIMGIINGTTNFILTKMKEDGMDFGEALQLATDLGYAEADPTADIEGYDAGRKLAIMASIAFHTPVTFDDVFTEGITKITAKDMRYAKEMGCSIKLLGIAKNTETGIEVKVHPTMIPENHPWQQSTIPLMPYLYMGMRWMMRCFTDAVQGPCRPAVPLWAILWMWRATCFSTATDALGAAATRTCQSSGLAIQPADITSA